MARFIEVRLENSAIREVAVKPGDLLQFHASGGVVTSGGEFLRSLGSFTAAVVGDEGTVLTPVGPPNVVLFLAENVGCAKIQVFKGDPFHRSHPVTYTVTVGEDG